MSTLDSYSFYKLKKTHITRNRIVAIVYNHMCDNKKKNNNQKLILRENQIADVLFVFSLISKMSGTNKRIVGTNVKRTNQNLCRPGVMFNVRILNKQIPTKIIFSS